ncbi:MAG: glycosyltransferase family 1 protein [Vicinamibacterales bacterium]|nr:glycosyltransferase family 1 protein [Vicinamibacterales bacterium]
MRLLVDYRPALRARTGVGEWVHQLVKTVLSLGGEPSGEAAPDVSLFVSSWKDRPAPDAMADLPGARVFDRRIPVRALTWAWNRLTWPPVEYLLGQPAFDATFSPTPLLVPTLARVRVVTVHDLDFLDHPERTWGEMRRDFPALVRRHVARATLVTTISHFTAGEASRRLGIPESRIVVCRPGVPEWARTAGPRPPASSLTGYILFVGTLEARKNVVGLLDAYARLVARMPDAPRLALAGGRPPVADPGLDARLNGPLAPRIDALGYLDPAARASVYAGARLLVLPSRMEGFGLPVLEAMALGVPVVVSDRGALPEVAGDAGLVCPPDDVDGLAASIERVLTEPGLAASMRERGFVQAARFRWRDAAAQFVTRISRAIADARRGGADRP